MFSVSVYYPTLYLSFQKKYKMRPAERADALYAGSCRACAFYKARSASLIAARRHCTRMRHSSENSTTPMKGRSLYFWS